jgi:3',5'-nucleoside bisphosphate phosphatase
MKSRLFSVLALLLLTVSYQASGQRHEMSIPDIPGYLTLKCDFHIHTVFSDGDIWPTQRVIEAWEDGLDAIAITDHIEYTPHKDYVKADLNAGWELSQKLAENLNMILVHGAEITRKMPPGHMNALFIKDANELTDPDLMKTIEAAVKQGAFIQYNHPGWKAQEPDGIPKLYPIHKELISKGWLNGIEYYNDVEYYPLVLDMCRDNKLAVMGNSDIHGVISENYPYPEYSHRPVTLVFAKDRTSESLREALFAGRTAVWYGDELAGFKEFTEPLFYASVIVEKPFKTDDKNVWFEIRNNSDIPFFLINGEDGAPNEVNIPAHSSTIVKADKRFSGSAIKYDVKNIITGNGQVLNVSIPVILK